MIKILSTLRFGLFWNLFRRWLKRELNILLAAINSVAESIDFKPVEDKVDDAKSTVISSRNAVQASVSGSTTAVNAHTTEERETIMGGKMATYEEDYLPAAQYGTDNTDFRPVVIGDMDYTISEDDAFGLANGVAVGTVFRVMEDNSGDEHDMMSVPKTVDETTLTVASYDDEPTIEGVTEWLNFEKDKCYIVTGIYEVADGEGDTWLVYTFDEYEPGRSGKEIYDKLDNLNFGPLAKEAQATANKDEILAAIPQECSDADIDHMFETTTEDGLIIVPSGLIGPDGTMPIGVFTAVTGLTPVN